MGASLCTSTAPSRAILTPRRRSAFALARASTTTTLTGRTSSRACTPRTKPRSSCTPFCLRTCARPSPTSSAPPASRRASSLSPRHRWTCFLDDSSCPRPSASGKAVVLGHQQNPVRPQLGPCRDFHRPDVDGLLVLQQLPVRGLPLLRPRKRGSGSLGYSDA